jgi:hypothetical protein
MANQWVIVFDTKAEAEDCAAELADPSEPDWESWQVVDIL